MRQVRRKDKLRLDDAEEQTDDDHVTDNRKQLPDTPGCNQERSEGCDGGEHPENDRHRHFGGAFNRRVEPILALLLVGVDALAHDDGIVHDDTEHEDEGEHRQRADGDAQGAEDRESAQHGDGNPGRDPHGQPELQRQGQQQQHQRQTGGGRPEQDVDARLQRFGLVPPDCQINAVRHAPAGLFHIGPDVIADFDHVFVADLVDPDDGRGLAVEPR